MTVSSTIAFFSFRFNLAVALSAAARPARHEQKVND
jgi:hypothetical protein